MPRGWPPPLAFLLRRSSRVCALPGVPFTASTPWSSPARSARGSLTASRPWPSPMALGTSMASFATRQGRRSSSGAWMAASPWRRP
eukprot:2817558-Alexandrium_andersonii.AAC.1